MKAMQLQRPASIETSPLVLQELDVPQPGPHEVLLRIHACGVCHTDLHVVEGDLRLPKLPVIPGHQIVGTVEAVGEEVTHFSGGERVGVPWLATTCGECSFCRSGRENLCENARFTGYHVDGGFAEYAVVHESSAYPLPGQFTDAQAAPLLCAGVIGYRALRLSGIVPGGRLALFGFGASAHIALQIARHQGCEVYVYTRSPNHRALAEELGAAWTGGADDSPPHRADTAIIFAPAGALVHAALRAVGRGGTVALAGIHMSDIPPLPYALLYEERTLRSVANSTHDDVRELLKVAAEVPVRTEVELFPLEEANRVLGMLKRSELKASGVMLTSLPPDPHPRSASSRSPSTFPPPRARS